MQWGWLSAAALLLTAEKSLASDTCDAIERKYRTAQIHVISARFDVRLQKSAPQQSVAWQAVSAAHAEVANILSLGQMYGCKVGIPRYPSGVVSEDLDDDCDYKVRNATYSEKPMLTAKECAHLRLAIQTVGDITMK